MLRFAGVDLLMPDDSGQLSEWLRNYQPLENTQIASEMIPRTSDNWRGRYSAHTATPGIPKFNWPDCPQLGLNQLYWPTGASRWSMFFGLVDTERKDAILAATGPQTAGTLILGDSRLKPSDIETQTATGGYLKVKVDDEWLFALGTEMYLLPPRPISASDDTGGIPGLWLIPLVDVRYHWQFKHAGELDLGSWDDAYSGLATQLGVSVSHDTVNANYFTPNSTELSRLYGSAPVLLEVVAANTGQRIVRQVDGTVSAELSTSAESTLDSNLNGNPPFDVWNQIAGGDFSEEADGAIRPASVLVTFPKPAAAAANGVATISVSAVDTDNATGLVKVFHDTAQYSTDSDDPNTTLAEQIAEDYYGWLTKRFDYTFAGVKPWNSTGFDDAIVWSFGLQRDDGSYKADTRVCSLPYNFGIDELHHQDGTDATEVCGYEARARCNGSIIENCTYYTCRNAITHALASRELVVCDTDSSSTDDPGGSGGGGGGTVSIGACDIATTLYAHFEETLGNCTCTPTDGTLALSWDGSKWAGSWTHCGQSQSIEFQHMGGNDFRVIWFCDPDNHLLTLSTGIDCNAVNRRFDFSGSGSSVGFGIACGGGSWNMEITINDTE